MFCKLRTKLHAIHERKRERDCVEHMQVVKSLESASVHRYPVKLPEQEKQSKFADLHSFRDPKLTKQGLLESSLATLCQMPVATIFARPLGREVCTKSVSGQEHY